MEPKYPAAMEQYVNLGEFYDNDAIKPHKSEIVDLNRAYKSLYARAYDCIAAANGVTRELSSHIIDDSVIASVKKRTQGIVAREIGKRAGGTGRVTRRFLTAVTCQGHISRFDTVNALAERVYILDNNMGLAHHMLTDLMDAAVAAGRDVVACPSPMNPERLEHLPIPSLSLAFVSRNYLIEYDGPAYRHIRLDAMAENDRLRAYKARIRFSKKVFGILMQEAFTTLADAKALHDELEKLYNPHVDFDGVYDLAEDHIRALTALAK